MAAKKSMLIKIRHWWRDHLWLFTGAIALTSIVLGYVGFRKYFLVLSEQRSFWDILYLDLQLFTLESGSISGPVGWELQIARLLSPAIAAFAALKALAMIFREQLQLFKIRFIKNHVVICGLGKKGLLLAEGFIEAGHRVVVIELDEGNDLIPQCREKGALVITGDATDADRLKKARVNKAKYLISVCKDDGSNTEVAVKCKSLISKEKRNVLTCIVHIVNPRLSHLLREREIGMDQGGHFRLEFFNIFDRGARICLSDYPPFDHSGKVDGRQPHPLVIGLGKFGENLVVQMATMWKDLPVKSKKQLNITMLDRDAEQKIASLCIRYPLLGEICRLTPLTLNINSPGFHKAEFLLKPSEDCTISGVYVCLDNDSIGLTTALILHQQLINFDIPITVRMVHGTGLATLLKANDMESDTFQNLHAFGLLDRTCSADILVAGTHEILARAIHEEYVRKQLLQGQTPQTNPSVVPWSKLPESLKESNRRQADHISVKLAKLGCGILPLTDWDKTAFQFTADEIEKMARLEHRRWVEERRQNGWKYAPATKDIKKKTTPHMIPWEELTEEIKDLDRNTVSDLPGLLTKAGFLIYRRKNKK